MSSLSQKETKLVLRSLEMQGATLRKVKKGILVLFPNGHTTTIHVTNSDHRSTLNMRAAIKRAGLEWPFDHRRQDKRMALRIDADRRKLLEATIATVGEGSISATKLAEIASVSGPTARSALVNAGLEQVKRGVWKFKHTEPEPEVEHPEIERARAQRSAPVEVYKPEPVESIEFIDERDSWTIPVPKKLRKLAELTGLNIEVRVWRKKT